MITSIIPIIKNLFFCIHFLFISYYYYYYLNQSKSILFKIEQNKKSPICSFFYFAFAPKNRVNACPINTIKSMNVYGICLVRGLKKYDHFW